MDEADQTDAVRFSKKIAASFLGQKYELSSESFETTWGFRSTSGKYFKISNRDMATAFSDILENWEAWSSSKLNVNSENPDEALSNFSRRHFSAGAHKDLAEVQRRGFLHLINAIAYNALHDGQFDERAWQSALTRDDYKRALEIVADYSEAAENLASRARDGEDMEIETTSTSVTGGDNILFYGAPGTGKSHSVDQMIGPEKAFRTVFHPDMQNSDFVGTLKPGLDAKGEVTYAFRPGVFAAATAYAWSHPDKKVFLVIEELNRAMAAAVFGELFQLLDRNSDGSGRYDVDFPSPEFAQWFGENAGNAARTLRLPSNLWILATMNSADQGVYPLDTAFRRRWTQQYLPIDYGNSPDASVSYRVAGSVRNTSWAAFIETLNNFLVDRLQTGEDRLIGPRFASDADLAKGEIPNKLLIYLWDDLLRHHGREEIFASGVTTFGQLHRRMSSPKSVFSTEFLQRLEEAAATDDADQSDPSPEAG